MLRSAAAVLAALAARALRPPLAAAPDPAKVAEQTRAFIHRCARPDGGYAPSPDPAYAGNSDTGLSDLAGVTYAATLSRTMGWPLADPGKSIEFIRARQQPDGAFAHVAGKMDPKSDLAVLYNTVQAVVALHALGGTPKSDPVHVLDRFFVGGAYRKLPWYTTSFFPLFYAALGHAFPAAQDTALLAWQLENQAADGYLGDHVAATFHLVHYLRLTGRPTPKAAEMLARVLKDQRPDGGWNIKAPDWDVHAAFDASFILRQLGGDSPAARRALDKAADWVLTCQNPDGGFGHYPGWHSDMDAVYFQFGTLVQAGRVPGVRTDLPDAHTLSWGHAMAPDRDYSKPPPAERK
jgi:geranylgeranyl transferase type-2 subunit beta